MSLNHCGTHQIMQLFHPLVNLRSKAFLVGHNNSRVLDLFKYMQHFILEVIKYHQLRNAIKHLNNAAKCTLIPGKQMSFNEGVIANKSNYNPGRQYNNSKPDKYRIEFFILGNVLKGKNFMYHIDVYQGKNVQNISIDEEFWSCCQCNCFNRTL